MLYMQTSNLAVLLIFPALSISSIHKVPVLRVGKTGGSCDHCCRKPLFW